MSSDTSLDRTAENSNQELDDQSDETGFIETDSSDSSDSCGSPAETSMNGIDAKANEISKIELKEKSDNKTYEEIRANPNFYGFTTKYIYQSANRKDFSSSAKISTLLKLVKLDLQKKTSISEMVFSCCMWFPNKKAIKSLIEFGKYSEIDDTIVKSIFEFEDYEGDTCLTAIFTMAYWYRQENKKAPSGPMLCQIEDSCLFLVQLAKSANLDLDKILNQTTKDGRTVFFQALMYSKKITNQLMIESIKVDSIDIEANEILMEELQEEWEGKSFDQIRKNPSSYGFTSQYLFKSANHDTAETGLT